MDLENLLTTKEAARKLGYSHKTLEAWRPEGRGPDYFRLPNGHIRYSLDDLLAWVGGNKWSNSNAHA